MKCCLVSLCLLPKKFDAQAGYFITSQPYSLSPPANVMYQKEQLVPFPLFSSDKDKRSCTTARLASSSFSGKQHLNYYILELEGEESFKEDSSFISENPVAINKSFRLLL